MLYLLIGRERLEAFHERQHAHDVQIGARK
jgi:hypothetical protein